MFCAPNAKILTKYPKILHSENTGTSANFEQRWSGLSLLLVGLQVYSSLRCSMLERIGSDSNLGLRVTGGLTFGPHFRGDGGIGAAPRLAAAHRGVDTNAPGGDLNQTPHLLCLTCSYLYCFETVSSIRISSRCTRACKRPD